MAEKPVVMALWLTLSMVVPLLLTGCAPREATDRCLYWTEAEYGRHMFWVPCTNPPPGASPVVPRSG
jgi:hypothetical protein